MGWNNQSRVACNVDKKLIREVTDAMVSLGLRGAHYPY